MFTPSPTFQRIAGLLGIIAGLLGPPLAAVMLLWPAQSPRELLIHPFTREGFFAAQTVFFIHHLGMVAVVLGFARANAVGVNRIFRGAAWLAVIGMSLLTVAELNTMRYADLTAAQANAGAAGAVYGIACNAIGLGLVISGIGAVRARVWSGWRRFVPLAIGIATFVELTPGMFGGFVIARLAIGFWIFLFAALGLALRIESGDAGGSSHVTIKRMDNVLLVVDDLEAVKAFFIELGLKLEGETNVEGPLVGKLIGLENVRATLAMLRTPDGHGGVELDKFHTPNAVRFGPVDVPVNALGLRRIMFAVDDVDEVVARMRAHGAELIGEMKYEDTYRLAYIRGPEGIIVGLAEELG